MPDCLTSRRPRTTERVRRLQSGSRLIVIGLCRGQLTAFELAAGSKAERCRREQPMTGLIDLDAGTGCRDEQLHN